MRSDNTTRLPTLGNSNKLVCVDGVWRQASQASGIDYSDGHEEESILHETLTQANNLAWNSPELAGPYRSCLLYTSPSPRDLSTSRMPSSA